jgi:hypothetical protein
MFNRFFQDAVNAVGERHSSGEKLSNLIFPLKNKLSPNGSETLILPVSSAKLSCRVAGIDSGFVQKKLSFLDLALVKTAGVVFDYSSGELKKAEYFPSAFSFPEPLLLKSGLERGEDAQSLSLVRLEKEIGCAVDVIKKFKPKYLFIDGSIVPQYQDRPRSDSLLNNDYCSVVSLFEKLYRTAEDNDCVLIACVEDSRGTRFVEALKDEVIPSLGVHFDSSKLNGFFDAHLLDFCLFEGERTFAFNYSKDVSSHAILKDFSPQYSSSIFVFYLKPAKYDKPLRVEFICKNKEDLRVLADEISSVVFSISSFHREYSFPSVLIEADLRAGLSEQEINVVYQRLIDRLGSKIRMRRTNRPFG